MLNDEEPHLTEVQARRMARDILEEEANQLCKFDNYDTQDCKLPHRVKIAIAREIRRLRAISKMLKGE